MDKIQSGHSTAAKPLWERQRSQRGHRSSVDGALGAHRKRVSERQQRVERRLNVARDVTTQFFPKPQMTENAAVNNPNSDTLRNMNFETSIPQVNLPQVSSEVNHADLDRFYADAELAPISQHAMQTIDKDMTTGQPDDGVHEDMPRGSYVDYVV